ncbi:MAG: hypothetical protein ACYC06_07655 [Ilumatobacteraceae bacterium]
MTTLDRKKWFDRMQPQTLQIATWLLYLNGFFALVSVFDITGYLGYIRLRFGLGLLIDLMVVACHVLGGFLMANERKLGYRLAVVAAFSPFVLRSVAMVDLRGHYPLPISFVDYVLGRPLGGSLVTIIFDAALVALLLHRQSRDHQRIWYH